MYTCRFTGVKHRQSGAFVEFPYNHKIDKSETLSSRDMHGKWKQPTTRLHTNGSSFNTVLVTQGCGTLPVHQWFPQATFEKEPHFLLQ